MLLRLIIYSKIVRNLIEMANTGTLTGSSLIIQIQIAIVGIIIVLGVFFIWRAVSRIEQRLSVVEINQKAIAQSKVNSTVNKGESTVPPNMCSLNPNTNIQTFTTSSVIGEFTEIDEFADEMIKVFGNRNNMFEDTHQDHADANDAEETDDEVDSKINEKKSESHKDSESDLSKSTTTATNIEITPVVKVPTKQPVNSSVIDEVLSEADTEPGNPLSKSKLKLMNVEKLKAICVHHNLSTEGSKNTLVSRILGEIRD